MEHWRGRRKPAGDWQLLQDLGGYAVHYRKLLALALLLLLPLAFASAIQPVLIGQAISLIRQEPVPAFLESLSLTQGLHFIALVLLMTVVLRLSLQGMQSYLIQKVGQNITADIRQVYSIMFWLCRWPILTGHRWAN